MGKYNIDVEGYVNRKQQRRGFRCIINIYLFAILKIRIVLGGIIYV
jgi:hypothetical protein